jgi:hypothetical protein
VTLTGSDIGFFLLAAFNRITGIFPGIEAAQDGVDVRKAVLKQDFRRTGARLFGWSGAIGDDPLIGIQFSDVRFELGQGDR